MSEKFTPSRDDMCNALRYIIDARAKILKDVGLPEDRDTLIVSLRAIEDVLIELREVTDD